MNGFEGAIHIRREASTWLRRCIAAAHVLAAGVAAACLSVPASRYLVITLIAVNALRCWQVFGHMSEDDVTGLLLDSDDYWRVTLGDGRVLDARLLGTPFVSLNLVVLALRCSDGRRRYVPLVGDACPSSRFRRLRVRLLRAGGARDA